MSEQIQSILELDHDGIESLIAYLTTKDSILPERLEYVMKETQASGSPFTVNQALEYLVMQYPVLFGEVYLNWHARDYQKDIINQGVTSRQLVLRLGRRLGKTECMCVLVLFHAYTQINKGENNKYEILIITPFETQIDLIFGRLHQMIDGSPLLKKLLSRDIHHRIEFEIPTPDGIITTKIVGLTASSKSNTGAASIRGQSADFILIDEGDYVGSSEITNIINIRNEDPSRIKLVVGSTPSGKREEYYRWCTGATLRFAPKEEDIKNNTFTGYEAKRTSSGNGWTEIYAPSTVNAALLKVNPDTNQTYLEDIKSELTEMRYVQEVLAMFGEEEYGVYQKKYIDAAIELGEKIGHKYVDEMTPEQRLSIINSPKPGPIILGVDWDKYGACTNMVAIMVDKIQIDNEGKLFPRFKVMFRVEVPRSEFTYTEAVNKIIELNDIWKFDYIAIDRGYGETQIELLHQYGKQNPNSNLTEKIIAYSFSQKLEMIDPVTHEKDMKPIKPFMVNSSVLVFEKGGIVMNPKDKKMREQFEKYRVKSISQTGLPIFTDEDEHIVDATNLAILAFEQKLGNWFKRITSSKMLPLSGRINTVNTGSNAGATSVSILQGMSNIKEVKNYGWIAPTEVRPKSGFSGRTMW